MLSIDMQFMSSGQPTPNFKRLCIPHRTPWRYTNVVLLLTIGREISPTPPLIFTGKKCEIWRRLKHHSTLSRPRL